MLIGHLNVHLALKYLSGTYILIWHLNSELALKDSFDTYTHMALKYPSGT